MLEDTVVLGIHELIVTILPEHVATKVDRIGNFRLAIGVVYNIRRATTNIHHSNGFHVLESSLCREVIIRSLGFSIACELLVSGIQIQDVLGFFLPDLLKVSANAFLETQRTEPDNFCSGNNSVFLQDVSFDEKEYFTNKYSEILFVFRPLDVGDDGLVAGTTELLIEEGDIAIVKEYRLSGIVTCHAECGANREPIRLVIDESWNEFRLDQSLERIGNLSFNSGN